MSDASTAMRITKYGRPGKHAFNADMRQHEALSDNIKADIMDNKGKVPRSDTVKLQELLKVFNNHNARDSITSRLFNAALDDDGVITDDQAHKGSIMSQSRDNIVLDNVKHKVDSIEGLENKAEIDEDIDKAKDNGDEIKDKMQAVTANITKDINNNIVRENINDDDRYMLNGGENRIINLSDLIESVARPGGGI